MRRFRYTLIAVCMVLLFLGANDLVLWYNNQTPLTIPLAELEQFGAPREWLHVTSGHQDLDRAISTSGSVEMEALLLPLVSHPEQEKIRVMLETRDPHLLKLFQDYHFFTDTVPDKRAFRATHAIEFKGQREVTGMLVAGLIARGNQQKLLKLAKQTGLDVADDVIFLSEGKQPGMLRGSFFTLVGLLGLIKILLQKKTRQTSSVTNSEPEPGQ